MDNIIWVQLGGVIHKLPEGRICSKGGNLNSIGIESAVNPESNLWYTWQRTAQLVAKLMLENDLDITRVKGHHFYSAKDCPQPLLENDLEIWWKFIEMVEHEYDMLTKYKDYQFTFELDTETTAVNNNGRVVEQPLYTEVVTYTVTIVTEQHQKQSLCQLLLKGCIVNNKNRAI